MVNTMVSKSEPYAGGEADEQVLEALVREAHRLMAPALARIKRSDGAVGIVRCGLGRLLVVVTGRGVARIFFLDRGPSVPLLASLRLKFDLSADPAAVRPVGEAIGRFLAGELDALAGPVDLTAVAGRFQSRALSRLREVPPGAVVTYQGLAAALGAAQSQRAVGNAMARNPVPLYVPCHRVVRSGGLLGSYGGGVERKLRLLEIEGFSVERGGRLTGTLIGNRRTRIFCRAGCPAARRIDPGHAMTLASVERARRAGLRPCQICEPA